MNSTVITAKDITKTYKLYRTPKDHVKELLLLRKKEYHKKFHALRNVSMNISKGETIGIIGRNGSGKSTLLQIICGIVQPSSGSVETKGRISALLELGAGFNPEFSGRENVYINASIMGFSDREIDKKFSKIIDFAEIGDFIDEPVKTYSSGMYVRLAISIPLNVEPNIPVVDEALSVGDTYFQSKCFAKFREFQKMGVTILFVTHDMGAITRHCSKVYLLEDGKVHSSGDPKTLIDQYNRLVLGFSETDKSEKKPNSNGTQNPGESRYGNGKADIFEAGIYTLEGSPVQSLIHGDEYDFKLKVVFKDRIENPILSFTIKDVYGVEITGTNTLYKKIDTGIVHKGSSLEVTFRHKILLNPRKYLLSFGCAGFVNGEYLVYDRRFDFLSFHVVSGEESVGLFDLESNIYIQKLPG